MTNSTTPAHHGHHRHHHHRKPPLCQEDDSPERPMYRNVKPKVGHLYQTKLPKLGAPLNNTRPASDRMSTDVPHLTVRQVENIQSNDTASLPPLSSSATVMSTTTTLATTAAGYGPMHTELPPTSRGGLLVHAPTKQTNDYLLSTNPPPLSTTPEWIQAVMETQAPSTGGRRKTTTKRKYNLTIDLLGKYDSKKQQRLAEPMESDYQALQYLTVRHAGNIDTAQLALLVANGAGRAYRARRALRNQDHVERFRRPQLSTSLSWYERLERECPHATSGGRNILNSEQDMRRVWKAVLHCGQELFQEMENAENKHPLLSQIVQFIEHAACLPPPEESYGSRHVVVEGISKAMHALLDHVTKAHDAQAKLLDVLFDEDKEGVDETEVEACLQDCKANLCLKLDSAVLVEKQLDLAKKWQARVDALARDALVPDDVDDLAQSQALLQEASTTLGIRWRGQVFLEELVDKALELRNRLREWQSNTAEKQSLKFVNALVRDASRLNVNFPEVSQLLQFHQTVESWVERANTAVRSRISLTEIESLIDRAEQMPVDLTEFTNKLQNRISQAQSWISEFQDLVPAPFIDGRVDHLAWMSRMRKALQTDDKRILMELNDMATEGTRIPVEIPCVKLLLVEIDAKDWSQKAVKWIPNEISDDEEGANGGKRAKLVDIRDHLDKAEVLRERIVLSDEEREAWVLEGEAELQSIIDAADDWYEKYKEYLLYDNRRNQGDRCCLSIATLRQIVNEGNLIHANFGPSSGKMARILGQAETWYEEFGDLLSRCGITASVASASTDTTPARLAAPEEVKAAVESAESNVSLDLDEARALRDLRERILKWQERVAMACPKRSKRVGKGKREEERYTVDDLLSLIDESTSLPIKTDEDVERLRQQLHNVHEWRSEARSELSNIADTLRTLRQAVVADYGLPHEFYDGNTRENVPTNESEGCSDSQQSTNAAQPIGGMDRATESVDDSSQADESSQAESDSGMQGDANAVRRMISSLLDSAKLTGIRTSEEEMIELLQKTAKWIVKSLKWIDSPKKVYDKKSFRVFDEFITTGEELLVYRDSLQELKHDNVELVLSVGSSCGDLVSDQLVRLKILKAHRDKFITWFEGAQKVLTSKDERATMDVLNELTNQSHDYPASSDMVQKVRQLTYRAKRWNEAARALLDSEEKPTMHEAKEMLEAGDKINIMCDEIKVLRTAIRTARAWANRVKRCKLDEGGTPTTAVTKLINEHDSLLISMPNEFAKLSSALSGYCICRQPYDGFMVGCDGCGEWYHGPCVGVTEARADKDKFLCVRCCLERVFKTSASNVATVVKNFTDQTELKKARQYEAQKHQRKIRKEKRDIEQLALRTEALAAELNDLGSGAFEGQGTEADEPDGVIEGVAVSPSDSESNSKVPLQPPESLPKSIQKLTEQSHLAKTHECNGVQSQVDGNDCHLPTSESLVEHMMEDPLMKRKNEIEAELHKAAEAVEASGERLAGLTAISDVRKSREDQEDENKLELRRWCIRIRSLVLVPSTMERAADSLPSSDGLLSAPMQQVLHEATVLGIQNLPIVSEVENSFKCIAWCCFAMPLLAKRPSLQEVNSIVARSVGLNLPEDRPRRMIKTMAQRARTWQNKAVKALAPKINTSTPVDVASLKSLVRAASDIPLSIPGENCVQNVIDDKGTRYCICGGPHFGSFMLGCDRCERWYHGRCVGIRSKDGDALQNWICPPCRGLLQVPTPSFTVEDFDYTDDEADDDAMSEDNDVAVNAPDPEKLWPPFGLLGSREAADALGATCCVIPDDTESLVQPTSFSRLAPAPSAASFLSLLGAPNGTSLQAQSHVLSALNGYTFGGTSSLSATNGNTAAAIPSIKPLFSNATALAAEHASSILSSAAALRDSHDTTPSFQGLATTTCQESENSSGAVHGFHGIAASLGGITNGFGSSLAPRESLMATTTSSSSSGSTTTASVEINGASTSNPEESKEEQAESESKQSSCATMNWKPSIMDVAGVMNGPAKKDSVSEWQPSRGGSKYGNGD